MAETTTRGLIGLVEDDDSIRELVEMNLTSEGYDVRAFYSVEQLQSQYAVEDFDLLLLDIMLPGKSGLEFAGHLHEKEIIVPVLIISALGQEGKITEAYQTGVIDYIVKPFEISHLLLKIRNLMYHFLPKPEVELPDKVGIAKIDWNLHQVSNTKETIALTPRETQALIYFLENPDRIVSRNELIEKIWGPNVYVSGRNVDNFLVKFRRLFEEDPSKPEVFVTYPKKGYAYRNNASD